MIAVILLVGMVAVGATGVMLVASTSVAETQDQMTERRIEQAFLNLDKQLASVARTDGGTTTVDLALTDTDAAVRKESTGRVLLTADDGSTVIVNRSIGSIVYESGNAVYAYQAGGVFRGDGRQTVLLSPPEMAYDQGTLTLPITSVEGDRRLDSGTFTVSKEGTVSPLNDVRSVEGDLVTLTIRSEYYMGWHDYFVPRIGEAGVRVDHPNETLHVDLGRPTLEGGFDTGVVVAGDLEVGSGNPDVYSNVTATGSVSGREEVNCSSGSGSDCITEGATAELTPLDDAIERKVEAARNWTPADLGNGGTTLTAGRYFANDTAVLTDDVTVDLSGGNVTLVLDGHLALDNAKIDVVNGGGTNASFKVYMTGDVAIGGGDGGTAVTGDEARRLQIYGTSELHFAIGQGDFVGTVYAPRATPAGGTNEAAAYVSSSDNCADGAETPPDVCIGQGDVEVIGAIIAGSMDIEQSADFEYDPALRTVEPTLETSDGVFPPPITFLHVAVYEVSLTEES